MSKKVDFGNSKVPNCNFSTKSVRFAGDQKPALIGESLYTQKMLGHKLQWISPALGTIEKSFNSRSIFKIWLLD